MRKVDHRRIIQKLLFCCKYVELFLYAFIAQKYAESYYATVVVSCSCRKRLVVMCRCSQV